MMFKTLYSARKESKVVKEAAPAINGKTKGTKVAESVGPSFLKISTPKIISHPNTNITKAPATAAADAYYFAKPHQSPRHCKRRNINIE